MTFDTRHKSRVLLDGPDRAGARSGLGEYAASEILRHEALAIVRTVYVERSAAVANILRDLAMALKDQAKLDEAEAHARAALEIYRRLDGTPAEIGDALKIGRAHV